MREEQFWFDNWDMYYDFYEFWETYHSENNGTQDCEWVCEDSYDCSEDIGHSPCAVTFCYDTCTHEESCMVDFMYNDLHETWPCDQVEEYFMGNETECNNTEICGTFNCSDYADQCTAYYCANDCHMDEYVNCTVMFINPYDGEWVYDWTCDEFEATFINDTDDEECEQYQHFMTCSDFSWAEGQCDIYVQYDSCSAETGNWTCDVNGYDESTDEAWYEDCTTDFEEYNFWMNMMREE